jgi:hypothetical protein
MPQVHPHGNREDKLCSPDTPIEVACALRRVRLLVIFQRIWLFGSQGKMDQEVGCVARDSLVLDMEEVILYIVRTYCRTRRRCAH